MPEGLWVKCPGCAQIIYNKDLDDQPERLPEVRAPLPDQRHRAAADAVRRRTWVEHDAAWSRPTRSSFTDTKPYKARLKAGIEATGMKDAVIVGVRHDRRHPTVVAAMEYGFIGGSMGVVVGEKIARAIERAIDARLPVVIVCCSGGARMMEGALSLMQMAKICGALARLDRARLPYIAVLTDPTTGGVTASFAMLGDLNIAEPKALIGFAGPRVIEQTIRQKLPEGFQRSEFLLEKGMLDLIVDRREMKTVIASALRFMGAVAQPAASPQPVAAAAGAVAAPNRAIRTRPWCDPLSTISSASNSSASSSASTTSPRSSPRSAIPSGPSARSTSPAPTARARSRRWSTPALRAAGHRVGALHVAASRRSDRALRRSTGGRSTGTTLDAAVARRPRRVDALLRRRTACRRSPTFFEVTTAVAFELFRRAGVEVAVLEVGLGGRLDATNVIDAGRDRHHVDRLRPSAVPRLDAARSPPRRRASSSAGVPCRDRTSCRR